MVLIRKAMKQHMMYRLYAVRLLASWAYAVHSIMVGLVAIVHQHQTLMVMPCMTNNMKYTACCGIIAKLLTEAVAAGRSSLKLYILSK